MLQTYQIYKVSNGNLIKTRKVAAKSAWNIKLNLGECVFGKQ